MKKALPIAIALAGGVGAASVANAIYVNGAGTGEYLIYPYYTVNDGNDTLVSVTNTTGEAKAVKVRFLEAFDSAEVLDFNLYLSPYDVWTAAVQIDGTGAKVVTGDTSCTAPAIPAAGQPFNPALTANDSVSGNDRVRTGYVEIVEMGVLTNAADIAAVTHVNGTPPGCATIQQAFVSGKWAGGGVNTDVAPPTGGLYGGGLIVNVNGGTNISYDATALNEYSEVPLHTDPGLANPDLANTNPPLSLQQIDRSEVGDQFHEFFYSAPANGILAASAALQKTLLSNDYVTEAGINASTDWVITFPTKRPHTRPGGAIDPFQVSWDPTVSRACEPVGLRMWDREELEPAGGLNFSPSFAQDLTLCWEANIVGFNGTSVFDSDPSRVNVNGPGENGWARFDFVSWTQGGGVASPYTPGLFVELDRTIAGDDAFGLSGTGAHQIWGLPAIGFAAVEFANGDVGGLLSNYAGDNNHKTETIVTAAGNNVPARVMTSGSGNPDL